MATQTVSEMRAHIMARAAEDGDFRAELVRDPRATISGELGVFIPERFTVLVHEDSATSAHLVLPSPDRLSDRELEEATGGVDIYRV